MKKITKQQVEHMAELAKLELTEAEKTKRAEEFSDILNYIDKLNEVDISGVEPVIGGTQLVNKLRKDEVTRESGEETKKKFVSQAPGHSDDFIETISPLK